jgi:hypothetical protein
VRTAIRRARCAAAVATAALVIVGTSVDARLQSTSLEGRKAGLLFNVARFVRWPSAALPVEAPVIACVLEDQAVAFELAHMTRGRRIEQHPIDVRHVTWGTDLAPCHIVYVGGTNLARAAGILAKLGNAPVLSVSAISGFAAIGVAELVVDSPETSFRLNPQVAHRASLEISSKLLNLDKRPHAERGRP